MTRRFVSAQGHMLRSILASAVVALSSAAQAEGLLLNDVRSQNGVQLTADELKQLMPNAKVVSYYVEGGTSTRRWTNEPDGKFSASSDARRDLSIRRTYTAQGTWHVADNGTYCVTIEWRTRPENWCRYIFKVGEKYYGVRSLNDGAAVAHEFEFAK